MTATRLDFGILLAQAYQEFVRQLRATLAEQGFTDQGRSDGYVFRALDAAPLTVSELAERLEISKQGAGQIVDDMERRGYVERRPDPRDGRARTLHLSERGRAALAAARRFHQRYERRMIREHGPDAVATLRTLLLAMVGEDQAADPRFRALYL
ncbi:MAG TPA: MarR family transcriptional regulator [Actinophytocola sp.]|uniref:MarR family winged helix-turn-helix transcriptional regulator n=1 Tax=Actinophytocola sp. TaxID=1872138 RepID=UPI002DDD924B|nr:MarR family transcriptional regulator [Actinophytocola sp.]HEV2782184.1 MarR family transcriptional regulator [Actinophytocola sp.]